MVNYQEGKIYKIYCNVTGDCYYGSTTQPLAKRISQHKKQHCAKHQCASQVIIQRGNFDVSLVENFPCNSKDELHRRERYYIENHSCVNKSVPTRTRKEHSAANKDKNAEYNKTWYEANKEKVLAKKKEWNRDPANKEIVAARNKAWNEANQDKILAYREQNKEKKAAREKARYEAKKKADINK